jgi:hypothetical protein
VCRNSRRRRLNGSSTETSGSVTAQTTVLQLMLAMLDHNLGIRVLHNHVHMVHVMHMGTRVRLCLVVIERGLMLRSVAALAAEGRCDGCRQK